MDLRAAAPARDAVPDAALDAERQRSVRLHLGVLAALGTASMVGAASSLYLVNHYPLLLVALSPLGRHQVLVAPNVDPLAFLAVGLLRRGVFYLSCFQLGRALGPLGIPWIEARAAAFARFVRWLEGLFGRAPRAVVLVFCGPTVAALAGIARMRLAVFAPLAALNLTVRLLVVLFFADLMRAYIERVLAWIDAYWIPGTVVLVLGMLLFRRSRRPTLALPGT